MLLGVVLGVTLAAGPSVAVLSTAPEAGVTELRFIPFEAKALPPAVVSFPHVSTATVLGTLVPGTRTVVAVAQAEDRADPSWTGTLWVLAEGQKPRARVDSLAVPSRPVVTAKGRVFVSRGRRGPPLEDEVRVDDVWVDEVELRNGRTRRVLARQGFLAFLCGTLGDELFIYFVGPHGSEVLAVSVDNLAERRLAFWPAATARDFVVDETSSTLWYVRADEDAQSWLVEGLDLVRGTRRTAARGALPALLPSRVGAALAVSAGPGAGLKRADTHERLLPPQGPGFERVVASSPERLVVLHEVPSGFPFLYRVDLGTSLVQRLPSPQGTRLDVAGVASR